MDLLILIVLVPLILIPIVLLFGFAGCGFSGVATGEAPHPTDLVATTTGLHSIRVTWQEQAGVFSYDIVRGPLGGSHRETIGSTLAVRKLFDDDETLAKARGAAPLDPGTSYFYDLRVTGAAATEPPVATGGLATTIPAAPTVLLAEAIDVDRIELRWVFSPPADGFIVRHRQLPAGAFADAPVTVTINQATHTAKCIHTLPTAGLPPGSAHEYQVIVTVHGFDKNLAKEVRSDPSNTASASLLQWKLCYGNALTEDGTVDFRGTCLVQKIKKGANLKQGGNKVRITLRGAKIGAIAILRMSISKAKVTFAPNTTTNAWDSEVTPTEVPLVGTPMPPQPIDLPAGILLGNDAKIVLDPVEYLLDKNADLLIAFDIAGPAVSEANGIARFIRVVPDTDTFFRPNTPNEAMTANRSSGPPPAQDYRNNQNSVFIVEQIDVLS